MGSNSSKSNFEPLIETDYKKIIEDDNVADIEANKIDELIYHIVLYKIYCPNVVKYIIDNHQNVLLNRKHAKFITIVLLNYDIEIDFKYIKLYNIIEFLRHYNSANEISKKRFESIMNNTNKEVLSFYYWVIECSDNKKTDLLKDINYHIQLKSL